MKLININFWQVFFDLVKTTFSWIRVIIITAWPLLVLILGILLILFILRPRSKRKYEYALKVSIMTDHESRFYKTLYLSFSDKYYIFPQVHLDAFLEHKINGQNWNGAFRHINEKSVDFVICDKDKTKPLLAIELDDHSHYRSDRVERDKIVEEILMRVGLMLKRFKDNHEYTQNEVYEALLPVLNSIELKQ